MLIEDADIPLALAAPPPWLLCAASRAEWTKVVAALRGRAQDESKVPAPCRPLLETPGKCVRAGLLLLSTKFGAANPDDALALAVAVELLHVATLFHDDVIDDAPIRRGLPAPATRWGNAAAVYSGGYLLAEAISMFAAVGDRVSRLGSDAVARLWRGEMEEVENLGNVMLPIRRHFRIVRNKTGALFELPCSVGAAIANVPSGTAHALRRFGARVGVAFQLLDDLRDIVEENDTTGKLPGMDVREGVCTLSLLHAARQPGTDGARLRAYFRGDSGGIPLAELRSILAREGSIAFSQGIALSFLHLAESEISGLPEGDAAASLRSLVRSLQLEASLLA